MQEASTKGSNRKLVQWYISFHPRLCEGDLPENYQEISASRLLGLNRTFYKTLSLGYFIYVTCTLFKKDEFQIPENVDPLLENAKNNIRGTSPIELPPTPIDSQISSEIMGGGGISQNLYEYGSMRREKPQEKNEKNEKSTSENTLRVLKLMTANKPLLNYWEEIT